MPYLWESVHHILRLKMGWYEMFVDKRLVNNPKTILYARV